MDGLNEFLNIGKGANVLVRNSIIRNMGAFGDPNRPVFSVSDDSTLSLLGITIKNVNRYYPVVGGFEFLWYPMISGINASLNIQKSILDLYISATDGAVDWKGGVVNVVSSQILGRGLSISDGLKAGVLNMVNSVFRPVDDSSTARIQSYNGGEANVIASTIQFDASFTSDVPKPSNPFFSCPSNYRCNGAPLQAFTGGMINLESSAVSVLSTDDARIGNPYSNTYDGLAGTLTADRQTYVQPVTNQDSTALKSLFGQPDLLTTGVPYALDTSNPFTPLYFDLPAGGIPLAAGPLINVITDADGANQLINPIDGSVITTDVFGNPRTANGLRDVGAVQASVPGPLPVLGCGAAFGWSRRLRRRIRQGAS